MITIQQGRVEYLDDDYWIIEPIQNQEQFSPTYFDGGVFKIDRGAHVYFIDRNHDLYCENVQVTIDVDEEVYAATPLGYGIDKYAEEVLRIYIMDKLKNAPKTHKKRTDYLDKLREKMKAVKNDGIAKQSTINLTILAANKIP